MTAPERRLLGGRYEVGELLGYGGMAEVHRGRDLRLGRDVAIKMLRNDLARDNTFQMRFRREAQNAASLNHPAIAAVYDTGEELGPNGETLPYIIMEFVNGRNLKEILAVEQRLQSRRALEITADICAALEFSHRHGIIHRDVKPGNVMVTHNGQVKVMDFGIARALASGATTMTQTSAVIGTAQYLSPEQARGEAVDARSDVYAAGCVLFELLSGHPPFVGDSPVSVAYQHVREDAPAPSSVNPDVGADIDAVVLKALAKNPANRYQSAAEMRADVLRAAAGRPVLATPVLRDAETVMLGAEGGGGPLGAPAQVGDPERRKASTWVLASLAALGVLAAVALIVGLVLTNRSPDEELAGVPDVVGLSPDEAVASLQEQGFVPEEGDEVWGLDCPEGEVVGQRPAAGGDPLPVGTTVTYQVCYGPAEVTVPNVVGLDQERAEQALEREKLEADIQLVPSELPEGQVIRSDPAEGQTVRQGTAVTLEVSQGNLRQVPNVEGESEAVARDRIEREGLTARVLDAQDPPPRPEDVGRVAAQSPAAGTTLERNGTVTIYVYREPPELTMTDPQVGDDGVTVTIDWDNGDFGGVTIDWGDGTPAQGGASTGPTTHIYDLAPGQTQVFEIRITSNEGTGRSVSKSVTITAPPVDP